MLAKCLERNEHHVAGGQGEGVIVAPRMDTSPEMRGEKIDTEHGAKSRLLTSASF